MKTSPDRFTLGTAGLRGVLWRIAAATGLLLICSGTALAGNLCITLGSADYVGIGGAIPGKGACKVFSLVGTASGNPGFLGTASICLSSDKTTLLLTESDGFFVGPETLYATLSASSLTGNGNACLAPAGGSNICSTIPVALAKCGKQSIPAAVTGLPSSAGRSLGAP
jgi:hypothetical protein